MLSKYLHPFLFYRLTPFPPGTPQGILAKQKSHDIGLFPVRAHRINIGHDPGISGETIYGLMWPEIMDDVNLETGQHHFFSRWLRHEDWNQASDGAQVFKR